MKRHELVVELSNGKFEEMISKGISLVDFYADWCMPCLMMAPVIEEIAEKFKGLVKVGKVNVEDNQVLAGKFKISSIPNLILFKDGKVIAQFIGSQQADELENKIKAYLR